MRRRHSRVYGAVCKNRGRLLPSRNSSRRKEGGWSETSLRRGSNVRRMLKTREGCPRVKESHRTVGGGRRGAVAAPGKLRVSNHRRILWDHNCACRRTSRRRTVEVLKDSFFLVLFASLPSLCLSPPLLPSSLSFARIRSDDGGR